MGTPHRWSVTLTEGDTAQIVVRGPYDELLIEAIKQIPERQWRRSEKIWSVPARYAAELLEIIAAHPEAGGFTIEEAVRALAERGGRNARMRRLRRAEGTQSLTPLSLNTCLQTLTRDAFPESFWIIGQIQEWKPRGYFKLVERYEDEPLPRAVTSAHIYEDVFNKVCRRLGAMTPPFTWQNNLDVRLRVQVGFPLHSGAFRLQIVDVDPYYTVTLLNERREEALRRLDEEGLSERNIKLLLAKVPLRIALLTSQGSDAEADFLAILQASGLGFRVDVYDVRVQGARVEATVLAALASVARRATDYDVVVITRGGGGGLDLSGFDLYSIGRAVCLQPVPVISGIGHQKNHSLVDDVARPYQTPTEAAHFLVDRVTDFLGKLGGVQQQIVDIAQERVRDSQQTLHAVARDVHRETRRHLRLARRELEGVVQDVHRSATGRLGREAERMQSLVAVLPQRWRRRADRELREVGYLEGALSPQRRLQDLRQRQDHLSGLQERLGRACQARLQKARSQEVDALESVLSPARHLRDLRQRQDHLSGLQEQLGRACQARLQKAHDQVEVFAVRREAADPARVLERGFAVVTRPSGTLVRDAQTVVPGAPLVVRLGQGSMNVTRDPLVPPPLEEDSHG